MAERSSDDAGLRPRFVWAFDLGQENAGHGAIIPIASMVRYMAAANAEMRRDLSALQASAAIFGPRMDALTKSQDVQDERIGNIADAVRASQRAQSETLMQIGGSREVVDAIRPRLPPLR